MNDNVSPTSEVGSGDASPLANSDYSWREILESQNRNFLEIIRAMQHTNAASSSNIYINCALIMSIKFV